jgi:hypothetical protein
MTIFLRTVAAHSPILFRASLPSVRSISRSAIPPSLPGMRHASTFAQRILYGLKGMNDLSQEQIKELSETHQKLCIAHYAIGNYDGVNHHYENIPVVKGEDLDVKSHYLALIEKEPTDLSKAEIQEVIDLFEFAIAHNKDEVWDEVFKHHLKFYQESLS